MTISANPIASRNPVNIAGKAPGSATVQKSSMKAGLYISLGVVAAVVIGLVVALGLR